MGLLGIVWYVNIWILVKNISFMKRVSLNICVKCISCGFKLLTFWDVEEELFQYNLFCDERVANLWIRCGMELLRIWVFLWYFGGKLIIAVVFRFSTVFNEKAIVRKMEVVFILCRVFCEIYVATVLAIMVRFWVVALWVFIFGSKVDTIVQVFWAIEFFSFLNKVSVWNMMHCRWNRTFPRALFGRLGWIKRISERIQL